MSIKHKKIGENTDLVESPRHNAGLARVEPQRQAHDLKYVTSVGTEVLG